MHAKDLSVGERLFLIRKRSGETMAAASDAFDVSLNLYRKWERDEAVPDPEHGVTKAFLSLGRLTKEERYLVQRRRSGLTMREIASHLGCCPWWVRRMELGEADDGPLAEYWASAA